MAAEIVKRYMVKGKRVDNGKLIEGFVIANKLGVYIVHEIKYLYEPHPHEYYAEIDPNTIEPLASAVLVHGDYGACPNCGVAFGDDMFAEEYCKYCGQCLEWHTLKGDGNEK
jgi:hypothetical protein